jgi:carbon monoxide dehydrogenase subunit G
MAHIQKRATIDAPIEKVFDFVDDPEKISTYAPNVERVVDVVRTEKRVGDSFRVIYRVLGVTFDEKFKVTGYERPNRLENSVKGGMTGTFNWNFEPQGKQTLVNVDVQYSLAGGPIGKAIDAVMLERTNEKTMEQMLQNIQKALTPGAVSTG